MKLLEELDLGIKKTSIRFRERSAPGSKTTSFNVAKWSIYQYNITSVTVRHIVLVFSL